MRILLSYPSENDQGEGIHFQRVLERLGHTVTVCNTTRANPKDSHIARKTVRGLSEFASVAELLDICGSIDLFLYVEPFGLIPWGIETAPFPTACIIGDVHRQLEPRIRLARFFDHVFLYQRNYLPRFTEHTPETVHWLPWSCDLEWFKRPRTKRNLDIAFIGKMFGPSSERSRMLKHLASRWTVNEQRYYLQGEIPVVYGRAKIVVNLPVGQDLNQRFFEALTAGALLVTQRANNGQEVLFQENIHYVAFSDERELYEKVEYYLTHDRERETIAAAGHAEAMARHGLALRVNALLEEIQKNPKPAAPIRKMTRSEVDRQYAWLYTYWATVDPSLALVQEAKRAGRSWIPLLAMAGKAFGRRVFRSLH